jgi:hypothetical protein
MDAVANKPKSWRDLTANTDILMRREVRDALDAVESLYPVPESNNLGDWLMDARDSGIITEVEYIGLLTAIRRVEKK